MIVRNRGYAHSGMINRNMNAQPMNIVNKRFIRGRKRKSGEEVREASSSRELWGGGDLREKHPVHKKSYLNEDHYRFFRRELYQ